MPKSDPKKPIVIQTFKEFTATVKFGGRGKWWWTIYRDDKVFATSRTGHPSRAEAEYAPSILMQGLAAAEELPSARSKAKAADANAQQLEKDYRAEQSAHDSIRGRLATALAEVDRWRNITFVLAFIALAAVIGAVGLYT